MSWSNLYLPLAVLIASAAALWQFREETIPVGANVLVVNRWTGERTVCNVAGCSPRISVYSAPRFAPPPTPPDGR